MIEIILTEVETSYLVQLYSSYPDIVLKLFEKVHITKWENFSDW